MMGKAVSDPPPFLSESLAAIPELPRLDQVIQIPEDFERSNTEKEIKK